MVVDRGVAIWILPELCLVALQTGVRSSSGMSVIPELALWTAVSLFWPCIPRGEPNLKFQCY